MRYSITSFRSFLLILIIAACLCACSRYNRGQKDSFGEASLKANALVKRYGQLISADQRDYLSSLETRLRTNLPQYFDRSLRFKIVLLDSAKPFAYSPGASYILISRGIIEALSNEAELAFLLAHEMAHYYLGHSFDSDSEQEPVDREQELAADRMALGIIALAGYDPRSAISALGNIYRKADPFLAPSESHPDYTSRLYAIQSELRKSDANLAGLNDRRDFRKFKLSLHKPG